MSLKTIIKARGRRRKHISDTVPEISKIKFIRKKKQEKLSKTADGGIYNDVAKSKTKTISKKRADRLREKRDKKGAFKIMIPWAQRRKYKNL